MNVFFAGVSTMTLWASMSVAAFAAAPSSLELYPSTTVPGATLSIGGKGLGAFQSVQKNRVTVGGFPALIQRWEADLIEVKVPFQAQTGPVEVMAGKKKLSAGILIIVQPTITAVTPAEIEPGHTMQITGAHFGTTAGPRDPNTMFGVNDVTIGGVVVRPRRWKDDSIEIDVPTNAASGDVVVRLASSDPLPDGSCCAPVQYKVSNAVPLKLIPNIRVDPMSGPIGTKVVFFGQDFGATKGAGDKVTFGGHPATIAQWSDSAIVVHLPVDAETGPITLTVQGRQRMIGSFTVYVPKVVALVPPAAPIGTLLRISGVHFGLYSESGSTPYAFTDFNIGENRVDIGGVRAVIYRWQDDRIDVWVPFSAQSGPVVISRGATKPNPDGSCCATKEILKNDAGTFTLVTPKIDSYSPKSGGLDELITIKGSGFGSFLKTAEHAYLGLNQGAYKRRDDIELGENVSRTEVLFSNVAAQVMSWTDTEIVVRVPHRNLYGLGKRNEFFNELATGPLIVRRGSWDVQPDGTCCTMKKWLTLEAGSFTIEAKGMPDPGYFNNNRPDADTNQ
ncbi:MAG: IPT/TIG domain-containing protein [Nitrospira sp.]|nr:IPT/TIG domain-containing protein [Nitrospira sp.]MBP0120768.1 IPT/TIG domain-containing protein [Nitrospira sp.]MBP0124660.1 IPT/TIG domain-containing protein [Nitrospira sp.]MBP0130840.1 IPT/TIG domain-containing protein [Nitrospira sp.]